MGWLGDWFSDAERSDGDTGKVDNVDVKIKVNDTKEVSDVLVSKHNSKETHDHYYKIDKDKSGSVKRVRW